MTLSSSRTLPGQEYVSSRCAASALSAGMRSPGRQRAVSRRIASGSTSSRRSRSGAVDKREYVQAVVQVFAETSGGDFAAQVAIRRRQHAHIERDRHAAAEALDFAFLQHAQQLRLQAERHLGDFVEQQRAALRLLELAGMRWRARR